MEPGGAYPHANATRNGRYGNGNRPPAHEVTPREKEEVLMAAGRLAAEYLVSRGDLAPDALENRPPAPLPSRNQQPAAAPRAFHSQGRPPAPPPQQRQFQWELRPYAPQRRQPWHRPFRGPGGGPGPFPKGPRHPAARPYPYGGARGQVAPPKAGCYAGKGAGEVQEDNGHNAPPGAVYSLPTAETAATGVNPSAQKTNQPSGSGPLGANDSE